MWTLVADCSLRDLLSVMLRYFFLMPVAKEGREDCQSWKQGRAQCLLSVLWDWWKSFGSDVHPLPLMKKHPTGSTGAEVGARCDGGVVFSYNGVHTKKGICILVPQAYKLHTVRTGVFTLTSSPVLSRMKRAEHMTHNVLDYETVVVCGLLTTPCPVRALLSSRATLSWQVRESSLRAI